MNTMLKTTILSINLIFFTLVSFAQKEVKFGEIDKATVESKVYDKDKNAVAAVVLYDYSKVKILDLPGSLRQKKESFRRIKILKNEGLEHATIEIPYSIDLNESIFRIKGYTYNIENGQVKKIKLEDKQIFNIKETKKKGIYKITMPNVKEGSVIDISYASESDNVVVLEPWYFQSSIPAEWSELEMITPYGFNYVTSWRRLQDLHINQRLEETESGGAYQIIRTRYVMKDIPAFNFKENYITTPYDYLGRALFILSTIYRSQREPIQILPASWHVVSSRITNAKDINEYLKNDLEKGKIIQMTQGKSDEEKIKIVFEYVRDNFKMDNNLEPVKNFKSLLDKKKGNLVELVVLLINHLRHAGLDAHPVLVSTRNNGRVTVEYPSNRQFNYWIAYVKTATGKEVLLDISNSMHQVGMIAERALSFEGFLVLPDGDFNWIYLRDVPKTSTLKTGLINITADGYLKGKITTQLQGYRALRVRNKLKGVNDSLNIKESNELKNDSIKVEYKNVDDIKKPLEYSKEINSDKGTQSNGDVLYVTPLMENAMKENPFKQEKRTLSIDLIYPQDEIYVYTFQIPEGYKIEEIPQSAKFQWTDGKSIKFEYITKKMENTIQISSKLIINRVIFEPEEYEALKKFYADIVAKQTEQIVLKKIK